jgi:ABC-type amino acid transport substrate-binding protein
MAACVFMGRVDDQPAARVAEPIAIAVEDAAAPWSQRDGRGYVNEVVQAAFAASHVAVRLAVVPYARCKRMVVSGEVAGCFSMSREPGLDARVTMSADPLLTLDVVLVARRGSALRVGPDGRLPDGTRVGVVLGYEYPPAVAARARGGGVLDVAPSEEINLRKLVDGRLDAAVLNVDALKPIAFLARRAGLTDAPPAVARLARMPAYVGFSTAHPDGSRARVAFDAGLRTHRASGRLRSIHDAWVRRLQPLAR